jgi:hypothetical protein
LRTVLVDQATGYAKYQIDTPIKIVRSVTRIRKPDPSTHPLHHRDGGIDSVSSDDITDMGKRKKKSKKHKEGDETVPKLPETSNEIARIHWSCFSSGRIVFRGTTTTRSEFLPKTGKMGGYVVSRGVSGWEQD